ncbi:MAG TPA: FtsX-like permease family protein [Aquabacterium sp.]|uniref:FtsX-like permease family protein n=1 Tax=Aquabacterium sp. TaxID=1872578 RepID=UPI002E2F6747|nr:FtsX-like permease family protein [Aquabacterium sp.]HEX5371796.1 FtsX-like permease family protein [Aquabacterium sp.]
MSSPARRRLSLPRLAWIHLWAKPLMSVLNLLLLVLGFGAITFVILASEQTEQQLQRNLAGVDLVVGAKGSPMQLILSGVFHLDSPTGNIPASAEAMLRAHPFVAQVIPLALGDSAQGFRIVGTTSAYADQYKARYREGQWGAQPLQAVIGAEVARTQGWRVGQRFAGSHGLASGAGSLSDHADQPFTITGVLEPTGSVIDRLILTPVESVWAVHEAHHGDEDEAHDDHDAHAPPAPPRELTLLLVRYRSPLAAVSLPRWVNSQGPLQSASPALEAARLFKMVGVGIEVLQGFAAVLLLAAGLSVFIALTHAVRERQPELAMMRMLGASPARVSITVVLEALLLALLGAALGLALGHALTHGVGQLLHTQQSITLTGTWVSPQEAWIPLLAVGLALLACLGPTWRAYRTLLLPLLQPR